jgi:hypothetical protein
MIKDGKESCSVVNRLPDAPIPGRNVDCVFIFAAGILGNGDVADPATGPEGAQVAVAQVFEEMSIDLNLHSAQGRKPDKGTKSLDNYETKKTAAALGIDEVHQTTLLPFFGNDND